MNEELAGELKRFLDEQKISDTIGEVRRLADIILRQEAEHRVEIGAIRGDLRGLSLRVGALEKTYERAAGDIDDSRRWIIKDLEKRATSSEESIAWVRRNALSVIASVVAIVLGIWRVVEIWTGRK